MGDESEYNLSNFILPSPILFKGNVSNVFDGNKCINDITFHMTSDSTTAMLPLSAAYELDVKFIKGHMVAIEAFVKDVKRYSLLAFIKLKIAEPVQIEFITTCLFVDGLANPCIGLATLKEMRLTTKFDIIDNFQITKTDKKLIRAENKLKLNALKNYPEESIYNTIEEAISSITVSGTIGLFELMEDQAKICVTCFARFSPGDDDYQQHNHTD